MTHQNSDNGATLGGYTEQYIAACSEFEKHVSVKPGTDLGDRFVAFDHDEQSYIRMNGWLWAFEAIVA